MERVSAGSVFFQKVRLGELAKGASRVEAGYSGQACGGGEADIRARV